MKLNGKKTNTISMAITKQNTRRRTISTGKLRKTKENLSLRTDFNTINDKFLLTSKFTD